jgi:hypothetical protein
MWVNKNLRLLLIHRLVIGRKFLSALDAVTPSPSRRELAEGIHESLYCVGSERQICETYD